VRFPWWSTVPYFPEVFKLSLGCVVGCIRSGVKVWRVVEVIVQELTACSARRLLEKPLGLKLLRP
jgi:predicted DNA-binding protein with PD1-like motif